MGGTRRDPGGRRMRGSARLTLGVRRPAWRSAATAGAGGGRHDLDLVRCRRPRAQALPGGCRGLGQADRQPGQGHLDPELGHRAPGPLPAAARRQVARHRRVPDRRHLAGHPRQPLRRPHRQDPGRRGRDRTSRRSSRTTRSTASSSPCRGSPTPACSTTARTCSRPPASSRPRPGPSSPRPPRSCRTRRAQAATTACGATSTRARPTRA